MNVIADSLISQWTWDLDSQTTNKHGEGEVVEAEKPSLSLYEQTQELTT